MHQHLPLSMPLPLSRCWDRGWENIWVIMYHSATVMKYVGRGLSALHLSSLGLGGLGLGSRVGAVACFVSAFLYAASVPIHKCPVSVLRCSERLAPALWCVPVSALYLHTRSRARHVTCRRVVHRLLLLLIR